MGLRRTFSLGLPLACCFSNQWAVVQKVGSNGNPHVYARVEQDYSHHERTPGGCWKAWGWGPNTVLPGSLLNALCGECSIHNQCWENLGQLLLRKVPLPCPQWYTVLYQRQTMVHIMLLTQVRTPSRSFKEKNCNSSSLLNPVCTIGHLLCMKTKSQKPESHSLTQF